MLGPSSQSPANQFRSPEGVLKLLMCDQDELSQLLTHFVPFSACVSFRETERQGVMVRSRLPLGSLLRCSERSARAPAHDGSSLSFPYLPLGQFSCCCRLCRYCSPKAVILFRCSLASPLIRSLSGSETFPGPSSAASRSLSEMMPFPRRNIT